MAKLKPFGWVFTPHQKSKTRIDLTPTPIVLCQDCENYIEWSPGYMICALLGEWYGNTEPNDFCSHGEPKKGFTPMQFEDMQKNIYVEVKRDG